MNPLDSMISGAASLEPEWMSKSLNAEPPDQDIHPENMPRESTEQEQQALNELGVKRPSMLDESR